MTLEKEKSKLILHTCCAICAAGLIESLKERFLITLFFYNPNITSQEEYNKRKEAAIILAKHYQLDFVEGEYKPESWLTLVVGLENEPEGGKRCLVCFKDRLLKTAQFAKNSQVDNFTTTLLASHLKNKQVIAEIGQKIAQKNDLNFLASFGGQLRAKEITQELGLYCQKYCGCRYSFRG
ncbi:MAG: epoxyqueuosine reductase QueH [Candidatus Gribaldobacteria bacterium]|nr:epoxyqueuosine reductase QueH [Candidatus Gribaldobacteria bacterium]